MTTLWDLLKSAVLGPPRAAPPVAKPWSEVVAKPAKRKPQRSSLSLGALTKGEGRGEGSQSPAVPPRSTSSSSSSSSRSLAHLPAQARYDALVELMCSTHKVKVRKWRTSMSGVAFIMRRRDGSSPARYIEAPRPKGPMSAAVFLHEIGHHAIGLGIHKPRCLEEYLAWQWSLEAMRAHGIQITDSVDHRVKLSLWYAVDKAARRGLKQFPPELEPYRTRPPRRTKRTQ